MTKSKYKYEILVDILAEKSESLPSGSRLPSIRSLMKRYGFTLQTVNTALAELEKRGLVERRRASGIYSRKETATRYIELHCSLFMGMYGHFKDVSINNAVTEAGWSLGIRRHHLTLDDPSYMPDPAASAHVMHSELVSHDRPFFKLLLQQNRPIVIIGRQPDSSLDTIAMSDHQAMSPLVKHLIALDHRRIAYLANEPDVFDSRLRLRVFSEVLSIFDLAPPLVIDCSTQRGELSSAKAYDTMKRYLGTLTNGVLPFTAIVAQSLGGAIGTIRAMYEAGISVPKQCSVASLSINPESAFHVPSITETSTDPSGWGKATVEILRRRFVGENSEPICIELPPKLNIGESTGPAPLD